MRVNDLQNGQVVRARWGRYRDDMDHPDWGPWQDVKLYVQRAQMRRNQPEEVVIITLADHNWAEYNPRHDGPFSGPGYSGQFEAEGYYLEIEGLTP